MGSGLALVLFFYIIPVSLVYLLTLCQVDLSFDSSVDTRCMVRGGHPPILELEYCNRELHIAWSQRGRVESETGLSPAPRESIELSIL